MNSDDPKFTAHVLGEIEDLTPEERAEIEALVFGDAAAAAEAAETRALAARLRAELPGEAAVGLGERQRAVVLKAAASAVPPGSVVPFPRRTTALAAMAASLVVGVTAALVYREMRPMISKPPRTLSDDAAAFAEAYIRDENLRRVPSLAAGYVPPPPIAIGNVTLTKAVNVYVPRSSMEMPSAPQIDVLVLNGNSNNTGPAVVDAGTMNSVSTTFVTTTTTNQIGFTEFNTFTATIGSQPIVAMTATLQTSVSGVLNLSAGSTVTVGNTDADGAADPAVAELVGLVMRDRVASSAAADVSGSGNVKAMNVAENAFLNVRENPLSTFGGNVGTASYALVRRYLEAHQRPPHDAVRIEELINYFTYDYALPQGDIPFSATLEVAECPWTPEHRLARIGIRATSGVNVQVEFNPAQVESYHLIGYEGRSRPGNDGNRDGKDAGEITAGHVVTALYELVPARKELPPPTLPTGGALGLEPQPQQKPIAPSLVDGAPAKPINLRSTDSANGTPAMPVQLGREAFTLRLRYKAPGSGTSKQLVFPFIDPGTTWEQSSPDFRFAAAVAGYGMFLRDSSDRGQATWQAIDAWARQGLGADGNGRRAEFLGLVEKAKAVSP